MLECTCFVYCMQAASKADGSPGSSSADGGGTGGGGDSRQRADTIPGSEGRKQTRHDIEEGRQEVWKQGVGPATP
jgi:hypothetical protein